MKKSAQKVKLIEMIDKKMPLDALEGFLGGDQDHVINELETIVMAGTKLNVQHLFPKKSMKNSMMKCGTFTGT